MAMGAITLLTAEKYLNLPDEPGKQELLDGELIAVPPARIAQVRTARNLENVLGAVLGRSRTWISAAYQLRRGWLIPDVSVTWPDQAEGDWLLSAPMIAIEIVSPESRAHYIDKKTAAYLEEGAAEVWVVYPDSAGMTVFRKESWQRITETYDAKILGLSIHVPSIMGQA